MKKMRYCLSFILSLVMMISLMSTIHAKSITLTSTKAYKYSLEAGIYKMTLLASKDTTAQFYKKKIEAKKGYGITGIEESYISARANKEKDCAFTIDTKGNYYLSLSTESENVLVEVNVTQASIGGKLTSGTTLLGSSRADNKTIAYYQFKMKKDGYVSLDIDGLDDLSSYVIVCDQTKKAMHSWAYGYTDSRSLKAIALKKGTYYFAVRSYDLVYDITATIHNRKITGGTSKKKAATIKKKKANKGMVVLNGSTSWYKYKLTKTSALSLTFSGTCFYGGSTGGMTITVYKGKQKIGTQTFMENTQSLTQSYVISHGKTYGKADAGTYYIKVTNYKKGCGIYNFTIS